MNIRVHAGKVRTGFLRQPKPTYVLQHCPPLSARNVLLRCIALISIDYHQLLDLGISYQRQQGLIVVIRINQLSRHVVAGS